MNNVTDQQFSIKSSEVFCKLLSKSGVKLEDIINDDDFLSEININNEELFEYLDYRKVKQMINILITEPSLSESSIKSFRIPFII